MREEMPIGFEFALAENEKAMSSFAKMTEEEKKQVMEAARSVQTKSGMRSLVEDLGKLEG